MKIRGNLMANALLKDCIKNDFMSENGEMVSVITHAPSATTGVARGYIKHEVTYQAVKNLGCKIRAQKEGNHP